MLVLIGGGCTLRGAPMLARRGRRDGVVGGAAPFGCCGMKVGCTALPSCCCCGGGCCCCCCGSCLMDVRSRRRAAISSAIFCWPSMSRAMMSDISLGESSSSSSLLACSAVCRSVFDSSPDFLAGAASHFLLASPLVASLNRHDQRTNLCSRSFGQSG